MTTTTSKPGSPKAPDRRRGGAQAQVRRSGEPLGPKAPPASERRHDDIDPRIRQRRIAVKKDEGRRRLRRVLWSGCIAGIGAGLWSITLTPLLDVDHIRVDGATHTGEDAVIAALDIRRGDALLTADVGGAASALASLPWIATADVRRSWPGTIDVRVVERVPVAAVAATDGGWVLVDAGGRQLAVVREPAVELVRVAGRRLAPALGQVAGERFAGAVDVAAALPPSLRPVVSSLWPQRDGTVEASVLLPGGATAVLKLGPPDQLEAKLLALAALLERADLVGVTVIDLRVPGAPALTRG